MNAQFLAAINQICAEKNISQEVVIEAVQSAIAAAYKKDYGNKEQEVEVVMEENQDSPTILLIKEVVDTVENENFEISLAEAKKIKKDVAVGDEIRIDVTPIGYGRIAAQAAKQIILQRVNEAERIALFDRFKDREGDLLTAMVNRTEGNQVFLEIEKTTVLLPFRQQIPNERYFPGKRMRVYLEQVAQTTKGPQLQVSRTHPKLVQKLLEQEIPEIEHGDVEVMALSRDAGFRSKVAVKADDEKIDPVGACIGQRGARIQPVMDELGGERVDIIEWDEDPTKLIARALQPAEISNVVVVTPEEYEDESTGKFVKKRAAVFVDETQRAMAIGKKGQNIRLASEMTHFELDMYNAEEYEPFKARLQELMDGEVQEFVAEKKPEDVDETVEDESNEASEDQEVSEKETPPKEAPEKDESEEEEGKMEEESEVTTEKTVEQEEKPNKEEEAEGKKEENSEDSKETDEESELSDDAKDEKKKEKSSKK